MLFLPVHLQAEGLEDDDFWLLLDYEDPLQNALWLYGGADELDGNYYGASADLAVVDILHFNFAVTDQNYTVETTDLRWGFSGVINRNFSWSVQKKFWGREEQLETRDTAFSLSWYYRLFNLRGVYESGDVRMFLRPSSRLAAITRNNSVSIDHRAWELSAGYSWPDIYTQLSYKQHEYDKDLSRLGRRSRLLLAFNSVGIQQAGALADAEASIILGVTPGTMVYELFVTRIKSAVLRDINTYATFRASRVFRRRYELGLDIELPLNDIPFSAGLSLGFMW